MKKFVVFGAILCVLCMVAYGLAGSSGKLTMIHGVQAFVDFFDEDDMASDSALGVASQQSTKAFVTSGTVTMTNKTLTSPTITTPAITTPSITGDVTVADDATGGNAAAKSQIQGLPKIDLVPFATMTNGSTETTSYIDDTPTGEWAVTANVTETADTTYYKIGANSYKMAFSAAAVATNGSSNTITSDNLEANESIGFWIYSDTALTAGWLTLVLTDDGGARTYDVPAVVANTWTWAEIDISALAGGTGDAVTAVAVLLSTAGAAGLGAFNIYLDGMWKWDASDELALGQNLIADGVLKVLTWVKADGGTQAHDMAALTENTDWFPNYQTGNDVIVQVTDQSTKTGIGLVAYQ